jgi:hypothetical protein
VIKSSNKVAMFLLQIRRAKGSKGDEVITIADVDDQEYGENDVVKVFFICIITKPRASNIWKPL